MGLGVINNYGFSNLKILFFNIFILSENLTIHYDIFFIGLAWRQTMAPRTWWSTSREARELFLIRWWPYRSPQIHSRRYMGRNWIRNHIIGQVSSTNTQCTKARSRKGNLGCYQALGANSNVALLCHPDKSSHLLVGEPESCRCKTTGKRRSTKLETWWGNPGQPGIKLTFYERLYFKK